MRRAGSGCSSRLPPGLWRLLAALLLWLAGTAQPVQAEPVHFTTADVAVEATHGYGPPPATVDEAALPGPWQARQPLPFYRPRATVPGPATDAAEVVWLRLPLPADRWRGVDPARLRLYLPRWQAIGTLAVYADGRLVHQSRGGPVWNGFNMPLLLPLADTVDAPLPRTVLIRLVHRRDTGGAVSTAWVGTDDELFRRYRVRYGLQVELARLASGAFLAVGLFSLAVWVRRRREPMYLLFFAAGLFNYVRTFHYHWILERPPLPEPLFSWLTANTLCWAAATTYFFAFRVHGGPFSWVERLILGLVGAIALATLPGLPAFAPAAASAAIFGVLLLVSIAGLQAAGRSRSRASWVLALWNLTLVPFAFHDWAMVACRFDMAEHIYLLPYAAIGTFAVCMAVLWRRYNGAIDEVRRVNAGLAQRLAERERELSASHEALRAAEQRRLLEQERQRLMQDMHDGLGSSLVSALRVAERGSLAADGLAEVLRECIDDLKLALDSLEVAEADLLLLLATLRFRLAPRLEAAGIALHWQVQDLPPLPWLEPRSALHVLRILQEALANVVRHAGARTVRVSTAVDGEGIAIAVEDDGYGLKAVVDRWPQAVSGRGMQNVRQRCAALNGRAAWLPAEKGGTRFVLWLPLRQPAA